MTQPVLFSFTLVESRYIRYPGIMAYHGKILTPDVARFVQDMPLLYMVGPFIRRKHGPVKPLQFTGTITV